MPPPPICSTDLGLHSVLVRYTLRASKRFGFCMCNKIDHQVTLLFLGYIVCWLVRYYVHIGSLETLSILHTCATLGFHGYSSGCLQCHLPQANSYSYFNHKNETKGAMTVTCATLPCMMR